MKTIGGIKVPTAKDHDPSSPTPRGEKPEKSAKLEHEYYRGEKHEMSGMNKHPQGGKLAQAHYHLGYGGEKALPKHLKKTLDKDQKAIQEHEHSYWGN